MEIITSYGSSNNSSGIIEIQARRLPGPPIVAAVYGKSVDIDGNVDITGDDTCSSDPVPCVGYSVDFDSTGGATNPVSEAGESTQITPVLVLGTYVDQLESTATIFLYDEDDPLQNYTVGSDSNYEIVFCDATQLNGNIAIYYDTCEIDNANGSYRYATFRWEDKNLD